MARKVTKARGSEASFKKIHTTSQFHSFREFNRLGWLAACTTRCFQLKQQQQQRYCETVSFIHSFIKTTGAVPCPAHFHLSLPWLAVQVRCIFLTMRVHMDTETRPAAGGESYRTFWTGYLTLSGDFTFSESTTSALDGRGLQRQRWGFA